MRPCLLALDTECGLCKDRCVGLPEFVSASLKRPSSVAYGRRIYGQHPCICANSQSRILEVDAGTAVVVPVAIAIAIIAALPVSVRACVAFVAESKVGPNSSTSKDYERDWNTNLNPF